MSDTNAYAKPIIRMLPEYEPAAMPTPPEDDAFVPPQRWSSLRPTRRTAVDLPTADGPRWFGNGHPANTQLVALLTKILEALGGSRQVDQLRGVLADTVYEAALTRARTTASAQVRYRLRSLHSCHPTPGVIEVSGLVETINRAGARQRSGAMAARLERRERKWLCTVLRLL